MAEEENKEAIDGNQSRGVMAMIDRALQSYQRLPMLEVVYDRLTRILTTTLRQFTGENIDVEIEQIQSLRFGEYLTSIDNPAIIIVFKSVEWDKLGLISFSPALIFSLVEVLFGGRKSQKPIDTDSRPLTELEQTLIKQVAEIVLTELSTAFEPIAPCIFQLERIEVNPKFATIARPGDAVINARMRIDMEMRGGYLDIALPYVSLEPIRHLLLQVFVGESFGKDITWEQHFEHELVNANIELVTILDEYNISLQEVMKFKVGKTLALDIYPDDEIVVRCDDIDVCCGRIAAQGDNVALVVSEVLYNKLKELKI
jgi:flagellar motor switch protein FliM